MLFLWNVDRADSSRLTRIEFYNSDYGKLESYEISDYKPYFLTTPTLSKEEEAAVSNALGEVELVRKRDLFSNETVQLAKVKALTPTLLRKMSRQFGKVWESEIDYGRGYVYDETMIFGAPYSKQGEAFVRVNQLPQELHSQFRGAFAQASQTDPMKYTQTVEWFNLCGQPIPEVPHELLSGSKTQKATSEKVYLAFLLARLTNTPLPEAYASKRVSNWIRSMIYTYLRRENILIPTSDELRKGQKPQPVPGALTLTPKAGTYFNTVVCDFESLYPSCIDSYNLSHETIDCSHRECEVNNVPNTAHHVCKKRRGVYSLLIGALKDLRILWFKPLSVGAPTREKRRLSSAASKLLKLISVSSYGVTIRIHGIACPPLAKSITALGRWALQSTWDMARKAGMDPIYGDTDSIFLDNPTRRKVQTLVENVKKRLDLDLAVEKNYTICVLPKAKKAYFGITADGTPDLKGLTAIKSSSPKFTQEVFLDCIRVLGRVRNIVQLASAKEEIVSLFHNAVKKLRKRDVNLEDLVFSVQLYYDPSERLTAGDTMPQPYQCALQLLDDGRKIGRRDFVQFVKVKPFNYKGKMFTVKPPSHVRNSTEISVEDYVRNLTTALEQTFESMDIKLETDRKLTAWFRA
jgi:DNA polymerase elongation subunit (family B)